MWCNRRLARRTRPLLRGWRSGVRVSCRLVVHDAHGRDRGSGRQRVLLGNRRSGLRTGGRRGGRCGRRGGHRGRPPTGRMTRHVGVERLLPDVAPQARRILKDRNLVAALRRTPLAQHENVGGEAERVLLQRGPQCVDGVVELRCAGSGVSRRRGKQIKPRGGVKIGCCQRFRRRENRLGTSRFDDTAGALKTGERRSRSQAPVHAIRTGVSRSSGAVRGSRDRR